MSAGRLAIVLVAAFLAVGFAACGDGDDSSSTTTDATAQDGSAGGPGGSEAGEGDSGEGSSTDPVPGEHEDSGGGSAQFRAKGGDNSVQEFGEESDASELDEAATALHGFLDARAAGDWESACSFLSEDVTKMLEKLATQASRAKSGEIEDPSCAGIMSALTNSAAMPLLREEAAQADVGSLRVEGDRAFIIYRGSKGSVVAIPMANEDGEWKVAGLGGTPIA